MRARVARRVRYRKVFVRGAQVVLGTAFAVILFAYLQNATRTWPWLAMANVAISGVFVSLVPIQPLYIAKRSSSSAGTMHNFSYLGGLLGIFSGGVVVWWKRGRFKKANKVV